jgi:hypothetical protein
LGTKANLGTFDEFPRMTDIWSLPEALPEVAVI